MRAVEVPRNDTAFTRLFLQCNLGDLRAEDRLVGWCSHFMLGRKIDPKLAHFKNSPCAHEVVAHVLLVYDARACSHPLHVSRTDDAAVALVISVLNLSLHSDGHCLKATMWVRSNSSLFASCVGAYEREREEGEKLMLNE